MNDNELTDEVLGTEAWIALVEATTSATMVEAGLLTDKHISPISAKLQATSALAESAKRTEPAG